MRRPMTGRCLVASVTFAITFIMTGFALLATPSPALAEGYQYTIRVFPGNRGRLSSDPVVVKVPQGEDIDLYQIAPVEVTDPKYVHTGFRLSGQDKLYGNGRVNGVSEDMDFVVAYGVEASSVAYTLRFVEYGTGRELAEPKTYYGKEGDKPVSAYEHIDGYRPRYLAITGTLHKGEENVWTFEYLPLENGETIVTTTTTDSTTYTIASGNPQPTSTNDETVPGERNDGDAGAGGTATTAENGNRNEGNDRTDGNTQGDAEEGTQGSAQPETQEILDLDTPLAGPNDNTGALGADASLLGQPAIVAAGCLGALAVAGIWFFVMWRRKAKHHEET